MKTTQAPQKLQLQFSNAFTGYRYNYYNLDSNGNRTSLLSKEARQLSNNLGIITIYVN